MSAIDYDLCIGPIWEIMAPVFFEMSDIYDEGGFKGVPGCDGFGKWDLCDRRVVPSITVCENWK
jgi:hypothetical protein